MRSKSRFCVAVVCLAALLMMSCGGGSEPAPTSDPAPGSEARSADPDAKTKFTVAWSIYVGWMPWDYAGSSGILKKWADKYGIEIELVRMDYIASVEAFVAKQVDACVMTNMEGLNMPAASGVDSTALILGDYSNGNDAILTRGGAGVKDLAGSTINLVEFSVSHYLLARALETNGLSESDVTVQNASDADIGPVFLADENQKAVVTWNPIVMEIEGAPGVGKVFTSADIPGEVIDLMMVQTDVLNANPALGKALVGAWYEVMALMSGDGPETETAIAAMADASGTDVEGYNSQLKTTAMYYQPTAAVDYATSEDIKEKMDYVRNFCFEHGLLGEGVESVDVVGISYPDGSIQGDEGNVKLRFDSSYMKMAADGAL
ncbi:MAG: ABC transporter substrate-binding protein [bacterium]|nr:ABC transporter substrate-binding protein [bacterium]